MKISANGYTIQNVPAYAADKAYIVARYCDDAMWFYGAYNDEDKAYDVADQVSGIVIPLA